MTDQELVTKVNAGDMRAFRLLMDTHQRLVGHMVARVVQKPEDREEVMNDVFMKVFNNISKFSFKSKLSTWIATIAYNTSITYLKKKKQDLKDVEEGELIMLSDFETGQSKMEQDEVVKWVQKAIEKLPVQYRTVLTLYHLDGMSYAEIGEITGQPDGTVRNYIFRARKLLKDNLAQVKHKLIG